MFLRKKVMIITLVTVFPVAVAAQPSGMSSACQAAYAKYEAASGVKAFAKGTSQGCGWSYRTGENAKMSDARQRALGFCNADGGDNCRVVATSKN
jgi:hypothetical protein